MDIFKTFEIFLSAPESIIKKRRIKIMHVETNIFNSKLPVDISLDDDIQLTVYNNKKVYNLLASVLYKKKMLEQKKNENNQSGISNERAVALGVSEP